MANCLSKYPSQLNDNHTTKLAAPIIVNERKFHLNKSKSKHVSVGLAYDLGFQPCLTFSGNKTRPVVLSEFEWRDFLQYQGVLTNYFYSRESFAPLSTPAFTVSFETYNEVKYIKLENKQNDYICFGIESIAQLWLLLPLIDYRLNILKHQDFQNYFNSKLSLAQSKNGDVCQHILNVIAPANNPESENVSTMMELVYQHPGLPDFISKCNIQYYTTY